MARSRFPGGVSAVAQHDGSGSEPEWLPPAPGREGYASTKLPEPDALFANLADQEGKPIAGGAGVEGGPVMRRSLDGKATVPSGDDSRGGKTRGDTQAADHDMDCQETPVPVGIVEADSGRLPLPFGSAFKTRDFIGDSLEDGWNDTPVAKRAEIAHLQLQVDNGPESRGVRTPFLKRLVEVSDRTGPIIQLLYYPPYHSKYNPIERCWGIREPHCNGAKRVDTEPLLEGANRMTWKGIQPGVNLSGAAYQKGVSLSKKAMREIEARLERTPFLPTWDLLIRPA